MFICRAHRDDQSAFTFLLDRNFGHGETNTRGPVFLNDYAFPSWHSKSQEHKILNLINRTICLRLV